MSRLDSTGRIFGIGLSRTGTTSLAAALRLLGYETVHYPHDKTTHAELAGRRWRLSTLETHTAATDISVAPFYAELDQAFPGSSFILTVRDEVSWLRSVDAHMCSLARSSVTDPQFQRFTEFICTLTYGSPEFETEMFRRAYRAHREKVQRYFMQRPESLLILDVCAGEGWEKLAPFLGFSVPRMPFPRANSAADRDAWWHRLEGLRRDVDTVVPANQALVLIDQCQLGDGILGDRPVLRFRERSGRFLGVPADDSEALAELSEQHTKGARFLVVAWPALWWLEHFRAFSAHLDLRHRRVHATEDVIVYELRK